MEISIPEINEYRAVYDIEVSKYLRIEIWADGDICFETDYSCNTFTITRDQLAAIIEASDKLQELKGTMNHEDNM